jgi:hypothetical protein
MRIIIKYDKNLFDQLQINKFLSNRIENTVLKATLLTIYANWSQLANDNLNTTREQYIRGLVMQGGQSNRNTGSISLKGIVPNMLEAGASAWDMKEGFAKSDKKKFNKNGEWYLTIPLTDQSKNISILINQQLLQELFQIINEAPDVSVGSTSTQSSGFAASQSFLKNKSSIPTSTMMTSINQVFDMYKQKSQIRDSNPSPASRSGNVQFRRVGQNSDPSSWIHKGLQARNFKDKALARFVTEQQDRLVRNITVSMLKAEGLLS